jgi:hypothetical protein
LAQFATVDGAIGAASAALIRLQGEQGCWQFELEADCTIPAEYIMMMHFMGEIDARLEVKIAAYLRAHQADHGGWPLYHGGDFDISCSVKATAPGSLATAPNRSYGARARRSAPAALPRRMSLPASRSRCSGAPMARRTYVPVEVRASAALVPHQSSQGLLLVTDRAGATHHPVHPETLRQQSPPRTDHRIVHDATG